MNIKGKVVGDYVIELPLITEINYEEGLKLDKDFFGNWGCSAFSRVLPNNDLVVARSLDLNYSNKAGYIVKTAVKGFNKTVGISYSCFSGDDFDVVKENGVKEKDLLSILFFTTDILNDKGLYIEGNMRPSQPKITNIKDNSGTNPKGKYSMSMAALIRFLAERCDSIDSALKLASEINVYGVAHGPIKWGAALYMADKTGHYGVLELCDNKLIWNDYALLHTNFYINEEYKDRAIVGTGKGRYDLLKVNLDSCKSEEDMAKLIDKVKYSRTFDPLTCPFDVRGELCSVDEVAFKDFGGYLSTEAAFDDKNKEVLLNFLIEDGKKTLSKSIKERKDEGVEWHSAYQTICNVSKGTLKVKFFEDDSLIYTLKAE